MSKKYLINTYGCQMNVHESEKLAGILQINGYEVTENNSNADIIIFNTCCIRESAEDKVLGNIGALKSLKKEKPSLIIAVCGCMSQKQGAAEYLLKRYPFIDIIFGTHNIHLLFDLVEKKSKIRKSIIEIWDKEDKIIENSPIYRTSGVNAWVNIMYGCNNFCTYCIVPYVRGRERSRDLNYILDDVKNLLAMGYSEITLLGQNVNSYGNDLNSNVNFANLLEKIAEIDGKYKVRFMTSHPKDISEDVVKVISQSDKLADYIHLPVQSGSDKILKLMNRKYTSKDYLNKIDMIRKYIPNVGISSDIMVGFPDENEEDFLASVELVEKVKYNSLYTFMYSRRSGTPADKMERQIDISIKRERITKLIKEQFEIGKLQAKACIGKEYEVLCENYKNGIIFSKSSCDKAISFASEHDLKGKFVKVKVLSSKNNKLIGKLLEEN